jgi:hypothetical protein
MPPKESQAGSNYAKDFGNKWGFNPYAAHGFIPNSVNAAKVKTHDYRRKATMLVPTPDRRGTSYGMAGKEKYLFELGFMTLIHTEYDVKTYYNLTRSIINTSRSVSDSNVQYHCNW